MFLACPDCCVLRKLGKCQVIGAWSWLPFNVEPQLVEHTSIRAKRFKFGQATALEHFQSELEEIPGKLIRLSASSAGGVERMVLTTCD